MTADLGEAEAFLAETLDRGHEGVLVKSLAAPYEAGRRGAGWVKVKPRVDAPAGPELAGPEGHHRPLAAQEPPGSDRDDVRLTWDLGCGGDRPFTSSTAAHDGRAVRGFFVSHYRPADRARRFQAGS